MLRTEVRHIEVSLLEPPALDKDLSARLSAIQFDDLAGEKLGPDSWPMGLEQHLVSHHSKAFRFAGPADEKVIESLGMRLRTMPLNEVGARPKSELAAFFMWQRMMLGPLDVSTIVRANALLGGSGAFRSGRTGTRTTISSHRIMFDCHQPAEQAVSDWLNEFHSPVTRSQVLERGIWLYMNFLISHPFTDGNGRTARLLFQAYLMANDLITGPVMPIAPFVLCNQKASISTSLDWEINHDPTAFYKFFKKGVLQTKRIVSRLIP